MQWCGIDYHVHLNMVLFVNHGTFLVQTFIQCADYSIACEIINAS